MLYTHKIQRHVTCATCLLLVWAFFFFFYTSDSQYLNVFTVVTAQPRAIQNIGYACCVAFKYGRTGEPGARRVCFGNDCIVLLLKYTIWPKVYSHLTFTPICGSSPSCSHKVRSKDLYWMILYDIALQFTFTGTKRPNLFQHVPVHKLRSINVWFPRMSKVANAPPLKSTAVLTACHKCLASLMLY